MYLSFTQSCDSSQQHEDILFTAYIPCQFLCELSLVVTFNFVNSQLEPLTDSQKYIFINSFKNQQRLHTLSILDLLWDSLYKWPTLKVGYNLTPEHKQVHKYGTFDCATLHNEQV